MAKITSNTSNGFQLTLTVNQQSQNISNNTSTLSWSLSYSSGSQYYQNSATKDTFKVIINGTTVYNTSKAIYFSGTHKTLSIASGTTTITHNADGKKTVSISCSCTPGRTTSTASYYPSGTMSGSGSMSLTTIPRKSSIAISSGNGTKPGAGSIALTITRASSAFTHTITWSCAGQSGTVATNVSTSASWAVPLSLITATSNTPSTVTLTCTTYNGSSSIGSSTCTASIGSYSASTLTCSGSTIGNAISFAIARSNSHFTHTLTYAFGKILETIASKTTNTSLSFTPSLETFGAQIPSSMSGTLTCQLKTYYGDTQIGNTQTTTYTLTMPSSSLPIIHSVTLSENNTTVSDLVGAYVQNKSQLNVSMNATPTYGASLQSYQISGCGKSLSSSSGILSLMSVSGQQTITYSVTDSRGQTATTTKEISLLPYSHPTITHASVMRTTSTSATITADLSCSSLVVDSIEKNHLFYKIRYRASGTTLYTDITDEYSSLSQTLSKTITGLDESKSYEFLVYVGDIFGYNSAYQALNVSTAFKAFDFDVKTGRLGIQKVLEYDHSAIEIPKGSVAYVGSGICMFDQEGMAYGGIYDNNSNLWIGSLSSSKRGHVGGTYISTGYDSSSGTGKSSIYIAVPNADNSAHTSYLALHAGNYKTYCTPANIGALSLSGGVVSGNTTVSGSLILSKTTDASGTANNSPALIVGGVATGAHLELDSNEIMAKSNGTSVTSLYLNNDGGLVQIGSGGLKVIGATSLSSSLSISGTTTMSCNLTVHDWIEAFGDLYLQNAGAIRGKSTGGTYYNLLNLSSSNNCVYGFGAYENGTYTNVYGNQIQLISKTASLILETSSSSTYNGFFRPVTTNKTCLGDTTNYWYRLYAGLSQWTPSDIRVKQNIQSYDERFEKMYMDLKPITYELKDNPGQAHCGLIAQWVKEAMDDYGITQQEFGVYDYDEDHDCYGIVYPELTSLNMHMIQKCLLMIKTQQEQIDELMKGEE